MVTPARVRGTVPPVTAGAPVPAPFALGKWPQCARLQEARQRDARERPAKPLLSVT